MNEGDIEKYLNRNVDRSKKDTIKKLAKKFKLKKMRQKKYIIAGEKVIFPIKNL